MSRRNVNGIILPAITPDEWENLKSELATTRQERDALKAERELNEWYKPCAPCLADDHENCTGSCASLCCALDAAEKEIERLTRERNYATAEIERLKGAANG